jgi:hypothetical protein
VCADRKTQKKKIEKIPGKLPREVSGSFWDASQEASASSIYQSVFSFFASQTPPNRIFLKTKNRLTDRCHKVLDQCFPPHGSQVANQLHHE